LFSNALLATEKMADYLWQKQQVTLNNIANVSTPGYKTQYVTFQDELRSKLESYKNDGASKIREEIAGSPIRTYTKSNESSRLDGNNVNMDVEQVELASTTIQYKMAIADINDELMRIKSAIQ
jgi:flagellar basal-body rod protein FlgB